MCLPLAPRPRPRRKRLRRLPRPAPSTPPRFSGIPPTPKRTTGSASSADSRENRRGARAVREGGRLKPNFFDAQYHLGATRWWTKDYEGAFVPLQAAVVLRSASSRSALLPRTRRASARATLRGAERTRTRRGPMAPKLAPIICTSASRVRRSAISTARSPRSAARWPSRRRMTRRTNSLALALVQRGEGLEAEKLWTALIARAPDNHTARLNMGMSQMQRGDLDAAVATYRELSSRDPENAHAFYNLGMALKQKDSSPMRRQALRQAVRIDPALPEAPYTLGVVLWQTGRGDEAVAAVPEDDRAESGVRRRALHARHGVEAARRCWMALSRGFRRAIELRPHVGRSASQPGTGAAAARRHGGERARRSAEAERLTELKADAQASTFAVGVGPREAEDSATSPARSRSSAKRSGSPPTIRRRTTSSRWRCVRPGARRRRVRISPRRSACHRGCKPPPRHSHARPRDQRRTSVAGSRRLRLVGRAASLGALARRRAAARAAGARSRGDRAARFAFTNIARQAGLTALTVYGGTRDEQVSARNDRLRRRADRLRRRRLARHLLRQRHDARGRSPRGQAPTAHLYRNKRRRHVRGRHRRAGLRQTGWGQGACVGDYRQRRPRRSLRHLLGPEPPVSQPRQRHVRGHDRSRRAADARRRWGTGCAFLDYDRDGRLDLFAANYIDLDLATAPVPESGLCRYKGIAGRVRPARSDRRQERALSQRGRRHVRGRLRASRHHRASGTYGLGVSTLDFDDDGWVDVYVANDSNPSALYRNNHDGTFTDVGVRAGCAYSQDGKPQAGMGVAIGDYDRNGTMDIFKTNFAGDTSTLYANSGKRLLRRPHVRRRHRPQHALARLGHRLPRSRQRRLARSVPGQRPRLSRSRAAEDRGAATSSAR